MALRELTIIEAQYLHDIEEGHRTIGDIHEAEEVLWEEDRVEPYMILDVGVRTVVMALLELGAEPFSSCARWQFSPMANDMRNRIRSWRCTDLTTCSVSSKTTTRNTVAVCMEPTALAGRARWCSMLMMFGSSWLLRTNSFLHHLITNLGKIHLVRENNKAKP